jgi:formylglycine-generating enzyme required for sulfatase activity
MHSVIVVGNSLHGVSRPAECPLSRRYAPPLPPYRRARASQNGGKKGVRRRCAALVAALLALAPALHAQGAAPGAVQDPRAAAVLEAYTETIPNTTVRFEMVPIPAGTVTVATPEGPRTVAVGPLWMSRLEVPWDVFDVFLLGLDGDGEPEPDDIDALSRPSKPYVLPGANFGRQGRPAIGISHFSADVFTRWLSSVTGRTYRLATEAEWEYACRAGTPAPGAALADHAWFWDNADERTQPGGRRRPNAFGLHDMLGNVAEWVEGIDGEPVVKGGSWQDDSEDVHCGARRAQTPAWTMSDPQLPKSMWWLTDAPFVGFRIVREP